MSPSPRVHVVAAALLDADGRVLIQRRAAHAHQGGLWEFPGGKLHAREARGAGLARELAEELGVRPLRMRPLLAVRHDYADRRVLLDVWCVDRWAGEPHGREGQPIAWVAPEALDRYEFPAADRPVLRALRLPARCLVTPAPGADPDAWLDGVARAASRRIGLIQLRAPGMAPAAFAALAARAVERCRAADAGVRVLVNADPAVAADSGADGVHLDSRRLWQRRPRRDGDDALLGVSCHDAADLAQAARIGADLALLGPVAATATHPGAVPLGWNGFAALARRAALPLYALGGLAPEDEARAREAGAHGIAAIRGLWPR